MKNCKPLSTLADLNVQFRAYREEDNQVEIFLDNMKYRSAVEALIYLSIVT